MKFNLALQKLNTNNGCILCFCVFLSYIVWAITFFHPSCLLVLSVGGPFVYLVVALIGAWRRSRARGI